MLSWLSLIPVVGKFFDFLNKVEDTNLEKYKVDGTVNVAAMQADLGLIQAQKELRIATSGDPGVQLATGLFLIPSGVWYAAYMWDSAFRGLVPDWTWRVLTPEAEVWKILMVVVGYLFLTTVKQVWRK